MKRKMLASMLLLLSGCADLPSDHTKKDEVNMPTREAVPLVTENLIIDDLLAESHFKDELSRVKGNFVNSCSIVSCADSSYPALIASAYSDYTFSQVVVVDSSRIGEGFDGSVFTIGDVVRLDRHKDTLVYADLTGAQLKNYLSKVVTASGNSAYIDWHGAISNRGMSNNSDVLGMRISGEVIDESRRYRVVSTAFTGTGGNGYPDLRDYTEYFVDTGFLSATSLRVYLNNNPWLNAKHYR